MQRVAHDDPLERLLGRQQPDRTEKGAFVPGQRAVEPAPQVVVVDGAAERVVGVERQAQRRGDERTDGGVAHDQRFLCHHIEPVARVVVAAFEIQQLGGHLGAVGRPAHQDHDVARTETLVQHLADALHDGRPFGEGFHRNIARHPAQAAGCLRMFAVSLLQGVAQPGGGAGVHVAPRRGFVQRRVERPVVGFDHAADGLVVEIHHGGQAAVVFREVDQFGAVRAQRLLRLRVEYFPVAAPPAVDRLLDVAHDQHRGRPALRHGVLQQGQEILPLLHGGVLEFVDHEVFEAVADLLVDERRVVVADEFREDVFGLREEHHVFLVAHLLHLGIEVGEQREAAVVLAQQVAGVPRADVLIVEAAHFAQQGLQPGTQPLCRAAGFSPRLVPGAGRLRAASVALEAAARHGVEIGREARAFVGEVGDRGACVPDDPHGFGRSVLHPFFGRRGVRRGFAHDTRQFLARAGRRECVLVLLLEQLAAQREDAVADVPFLAFVNALLHEVREPALQVAVGGDLLDERVGALGQHRGRFDLDVVIEVDAQLLDEGAQDALEEGVDRQHREARIVVQDLRPHLPGASAHRGGIERQFAAEVVEVGARLSRGQQVYLLEDARFHLLGGLVGEGHGEDVAVNAGLFDHVAHVFVRQLVGLARPRACIQNSRPHCPKCRFR